MKFFHHVYKRFDRHLLPSEQSEQQYQMIVLVSWQLIIAAMILSAYVLYMQFWFITVIVAIGIFFAILNLALLNLIGSIEFSGRALVFIFFMVTTLSCYFIGGISNSYLFWYITIPILAGVLIGMGALKFYTVLSISIVLLFWYCEPMALYNIPFDNIIWIERVNILSVLAITSGLVYGILRENSQYAIQLREQNYALKTEQKKLNYLARHDILTNLPNRAYFNHQLQNLIDTIDTSKYSLSLFFMDLNNFKAVNDQNGHYIGDQVLLQTSERLLKIVRKNDFVARIGGDEFVALIMHKKGDTIPVILSKRIIKLFKQSFKVNGIELYCDISLGMACYPEDAITFDALSSTADKAMYKMKTRNKK